MLIPSMGLGAIQPNPIRETGHHFSATSKASTRLQNDYAHTELILRFSAWAHTLRRFPTVEQVRERFQVSRATAYRWRNALASAHGIVTPANNEEAA